MIEWLMPFSFIVGGVCGFLLREFLYRREFEANVSALKDLEREFRKQS